MEETNQADITAAPAAANEAEASAPSQEKDPLQAEVERIEKKPKRSKLDQLEYTQRRVNEQLAEERKKAGIEEDDNRPFTVAEFKAMRQQEAQDTALTLADEIQDDAERKLTKYHLENTIKPSGDTQTDPRNALLIVNAVKNRQIAEEVMRFQKPRVGGSAPSAPPKEKATTPEFSREERDFMRVTGLTPDDVAKGPALGSGL